MKKSLIYPFLLLSLTKGWTTSTAALTEQLKSVTEDYNTLIAASTEAAKKISPVRTPLDTDTVSITDVGGPIDTYLDGARISSPFVSVPGTFSYFDANAGNELFAQAGLGGAWRTYKSPAMPTSWNANTSLVLTEVTRDGAAGPASPHTITLFLAKTGSAVDLLRTTLVNFLLRAVTNDFKAVALGSPIAGATGAGTTPLTTGWSVKLAAFDGSSAPEVITLDPFVSTVSTTITTASGVVMAASGAADVKDWNVTVGSANKENINLFTSVNGNMNGYNVKFEVYPGRFDRTGTNGPAKSLLLALSPANIPSKIFNQSPPGFVNTITSAADNTLTVLKSPSYSDIMTGINNIAVRCTASTSFVIGDYTTTAGTIGLAGIDSANLSAVTWSAAGSVITATCTRGTTSGIKYTFDVGAHTEFTSGAASATNLNTMLFTAEDKHAFVAVQTDATGIVAGSGVASVLPGILALNFVNAVSATTAITSFTLDEFITKATT